MSNDYPFHKGEMAIQQRLGVKDQLARFAGRVIRDHMPLQHQNFYQQLPYIVAGFEDAEGLVWASIITGEPGFMQTPDEKTLTINAMPVAEDPLALALQSQGTNLQLGLLGIELSNKRRNRLSTKVNELSDKGFSLAVKQSCGNCPQYIQTRQVFHEPNRQDAKATSITRLSQQDIALIAGADTFFVASHSGNDIDGAAQGADVSHRGGKPGFIRIENDTTLLIPDYRGNFFFNTLGNFAMNPRAGLLFLDFETGLILTLTGQVEVIWDNPVITQLEGAQRAWRFKLEQGLRLEQALNLCFT